ncbi:MAG: hypothetical protein J6X44_14245 [Thermoguttaceae bacterium]|nr:hypothetical protein [Thermoguttaceae bacterium]
MSKVLCLFSTAVSALLLLVFLLDIAAGVPFKKANSLMDIVFIVCSAGIIALSVLCFRKLK